MSPSPLRIDPDELNRHFSTTAERTAGLKAVSLDDIECLVDNLADVNPSVASPFSLRPAPHGEVLKCMKSLRSDCSTGLDIIPARFIKLVADHLADPLTLINNCIRNSYFPRPWKIASVSPIPKINTPVTNDEFRSISILPVLSKVFEKLVATQMSEFAEEMSLLHDCVSSFRKGHSTTTALLGIKDDIRRAMKKGEISLMLLADHSKAFDAMCFETTIQKFYKLGFSKTFLKWLLSYLSDQNQFIQIDDKSSRFMSTKFGIRQGSILGPLIFNLYVADLSNILPATTKCAQYADDTTLYSHCTVRDLTSREIEMNKTLNKFGNWSQDSNLALSPPKTKSMLYSTSQMSSYHSLSSRALQLSVQGKDLERVKSAKLLGVHLNVNLKWDEHVKHLASSCYGTPACLRKIKNFTPYKLRKRLAKSLA